MGSVSFILWCVPVEAAFILPPFCRGVHYAFVTGGGAFGDILFASSGAVAETILNLGHVLPRIPLADREGSQETIRFLAHLWVLSVRTESTPPEAWTSRFRHRSRKNTKKPPQQKCCGGWHPMQCIGLCPARPCKPSYNLHRVQQVGCLQHASPLPTSSRIRQPGGLRSTH